MRCGERCRWGAEITMSARRASGNMSYLLSAGTVSILRSWKESGREW